MFKEKARLKYKNFNLINGLLLYKKRLIILIINNLKIKFIKNIYY